MSKIITKKFSELNPEDVPFEYKIELIKEDEDTDSPIYFCALDLKFEAECCEQIKTDFWMQNITICFEPDYPLSSPQIYHEDLQDDTIIFDSWTPISDFAYLIKSIYVFIIENFLQNSEFYKKYNIKESTICHEISSQ